MEQGANEMKVILQKGLRGLSGGMEDWVYQMRNGKTYLGPKPSCTKEPSQAELNQRERFKEASVYDKTVLADPAAKEFYAPIAKGREITVYALAIGDYLKVPTIEPLELAKYKGRVGDLISITTKDDVGVVELNVELTRTDGT